MVFTKKRTLLWSAAGLVMSLLVLVVVAGGLQGDVFVTNPEGITQTADSLLFCVQNGNWEDLGLHISGNPSLDPNTEETDSAENRIWKAYQQSLQWVCAEEFEVQGPYVIQRVSITCLDISTVTRTMMQLLSESAAPQAQDELLKAAAQQVLDTQSPTIQKELTLTLVRENGRWLVVPNSALLALLSGFTAR